MPLNFPSQTLKTELSKAAKRTNAQNGLPPSMRGLPVLAIMAGGAISKVTNSGNALEERMLGAEETVLLAGPTEKDHTGPKESSGAQDHSSDKNDGKNAQ